MKIPKLVVLLTMLLVSQLSLAGIKQVYTIKSPDKRTVAQFDVDSHGRLQYTVGYKGKKVIDWSDMGLDMGHSSNQIVIANAATRSHSEKFRWEFGEREFVYNNYNEISILCNSGFFEFKVVARLFNGSLAFMYLVPEQAGSKEFVIKKELTSFNFPQACKIYQYHHESVFTPTNIDSLDTTCDFPATLTDGKFYISIGEAANFDFTKAELGKGTQSNSLNVVFARDKEVRYSTSFETPWRTVSFSETAVGLHKYSDLFLRLSPAPVEGVSSTIQPGKLIRSQLTTQDGLDCIAFAKRMNFKYIMFDAGWYGPERALSSDPRKAIPQIDLPKVIQYGKENGVGVILYVNYIGLQNYLDEILPLYKQWGVAGMKFGFIDGFSQKGLIWLSSSIKKVNDFGLVLNIHDNYKPTGLSRTFPALLTQEGIRGDENSPDAFHTTTLPYTRFLAGAADFTYCFPNPKNSFAKNLKVSKGQQLALSVVYYSPVQAIFWYGRPNDYTNVDEIEFFRHVPTVWDESLYLKGDIGKNISVARRSETTWFIGNAAGFQDWNDKIKFNFLSRGKKYSATIFEDQNGTIATRSFPVKKGDVFKVDVKARGGQAIMIVQNN